MIQYFKISNFKSINDEITIDFRSTTINEHFESNVFNHDDQSLLKSILLYGQNASGKSNLLEALVFMRYFVTNSAIEKQSNEEIDVEPFDFLDSRLEMPTTFEICFFIDDQKFRYGFEVDKKSVIKEWLLESSSIKEYPVFLRMGQDFEISYKRFKGSKEIEKRTRKNALFLSVCSQWNVEKAQKLTEWFNDKIITIHGLTDTGYRKHTLELLKTDEYAPIVKQFLKMADLGINDIEIINIPLDEMISLVPESLKEDFKKQYKEQFETTIMTTHDRFDDTGNVVGSSKLFLDRSGSEGTKKYFNMIGLLIYAIRNDALVIVDEFDARLHTLLSKGILKLFNSKKIFSKAQLLVASHDTALLDRNLLRRDQIYFVDKNKIGASVITSLVEYKPRKETPFDKNYLEGRYGGIPFIDDLESLFVND